MKARTPLFKKNAPRKRQWWKLIIWGFLLIPAIIFWYIQSSYNSDLQQKISFESTISITVAKGESASALAVRLEEEKIITSSSSFLKYLKKNNMGKDIKAGDHEIQQGEFGIEDIALIFTTIGEEKSVKITIPEGLTLKEMDARFADQKIFKTGEFLECIEKTCNFSSYFFLPPKREEWEGYFFPATYTIAEKKLSPQVLAEKMLTAFAQRIETHKLSEYKSYPLHEVLIMASIIEKEASGKGFNENEQAMISGILWNRIEQGIPLGADATIRYGLAKDSSALTKSELAKKNEFNTRLNQGFPPFAISAPGDSSLSAAVNPAKTDELFYLHDKAQKIYYAKTNAEHEANKTKYCGGSCE